MIHVSLIIIILHLLLLLLLLLNIIVIIIIKTTTLQHIKSLYLLQKFFPLFSNHGWYPPSPYGAYVSFPAVYITLSHIASKSSEKSPCTRCGSKWVEGGVGGSRILTTLVLNFYIKGRVPSVKKIGRVSQTVL
jgi:hypothetical protein